MTFDSFLATFEDSTSESTKKLRKHLPIRERTSETHQGACFCLCALNQRFFDCIEKVAALLGEGVVDTVCTLSAGRSS